MDDRPDVEKEEEYDDEKRSAAADQHLWFLSGSIECDGRGAWPCIAEQEMVRRVAN